MNSIKIDMTIDSLSALEPVSPNTYQFIVQFFNNATGLPLGNPNVPNSHTATITTTSTIFSLNVPVVDAFYSIPNVMLKVFANDTDDCCLKIAVIDIVNPGPETCAMTVSPQFIQCDGLLAATVSGAVGSYTASIKTTDDNTERFISRSGSFFYFTPKSGSHIYVLTITDTSGCTKQANIGLDCGNAKPTFESQVVQPVCNGTNLIVGYVKLFNVTNGTRYKICYNATFNCDNCGSSDGTIVQGGDTIINIYPPNQGTSSSVSIRVYKDNSCDSYTELNFTQTSPTCGSGCGLTFTLSNPIC